MDDAHFPMIFSAASARRWLLVVLTAGVLTAAHAAEPSAPEQRERSWDLGIALGYGVKSNPFVGADDLRTPLSLDVAWYGERFFFDNGDFGATLHDSPTLGINLLARFSSERIYRSYFNDLAINTITGSANPPGFVPSIVPSTGSPSETDIELPDRDFALNAGVEILWGGAFGVLHGQWTHDISNTHQGHELWLEYSRSWRHRRLSLRPSLGISRLSENLVNYYYGIDPDTLPIPVPYQGQDSLNAFATLGMSWTINAHLDVVARIEYERFDSAIQRSPQVKDNHSRAVFAGLFYHF